MNIEKRLENLEKLVTSLSKKIDNNKFYQEADINGFRQNISEVTPTTLSAIAYIDDTEVVFTDVPAGNMMVYFDKPYVIHRENDRVTVSFDPLEEPATITISIL